MNGVTLLSDGSADTGVRVNIGTGRILPNPNSPRKLYADSSLTQLADSIHRHGILQPLTVRRTARSGVYELISGERRLRAAKMLGMSSVPCVIVKADDRETAEYSVIDNTMREALDMFEQAEALKNLSEAYGCTQEELARKFSVSQSYIANRIRILRFSDEEREMIRSASLGERHVRAVLRISDSSERKKALQYIISKKMTVLATEEYIDGIVKPGNERQREKIVLHDLRGFYNSIDNAVSTLNRAGIPARAERTATEKEIIVRITVSREYQPPKSRP